MSDYEILAWQTLRRPPLQGEAPPDVPDVPLKALTCRNAVTSLMALVTAKEHVKNARLILSDLSCPDGSISVQAACVYLVGAVPTPEVGMVSDPLYPVDSFDIDKSAALYINIQIPKAIPKGIYLGLAMLEIDGKQVASRSIQIEVADVDLPDVHDWQFYMNIWMNPGAIARFYGVPVWSDEHFEHMKPYLKDLAAHGQRTVVAPVVAKPWIDQTYTPYPSTVKWIRNGDNYEFDFSVFDKFVEIHRQFGIEQTIHCYSIVQGPGEIGKSLITYVDSDTGEINEIMTSIGDDEYVKAWGDFFDAFRKHLTQRGWMDKTYIAFDEKPSEVMEKMIDFLGEYAPDFKTALAANTRSNLFGGMNDLSLAVPFNERGIAEMAPPERSAMGVVELLDPDNVCAVTKDCPEKTITTYYVCCGPEFPNTFVHSPLIESRMMGFFAIQGGYDGFLRWAYNDWSESPYEHVQWQAHITFPSGDTFLVYPGENGPISSLRWEQLREGIQDYELAVIASENMRSSEEMVDYEQAITLACRNVDGRQKSTGDVEIARRLLIPIAEHQNE
ncbi:MAG: glycoside hydrolase domain-containing protein [Armatimonadota bacterium]